MEQHTRFRDDLVRFAFNEFFGEQRKEFQQHLCECRPCRQELTEIEAGMFALCLSTVAPMPRARTRERLLAAVRG